MATQRQASRAFQWVVCLGTLSLLAAVAHQLWTRIAPGLSLLP